MTYGTGNISRFLMWWGELAGSGHGVLHGLELAPHKSETLADLYLISTGNKHILGNYSFSTAWRFCHRFSQGGVVRPVQSYLPTT